MFAHVSPILAAGRRRASGAGGCAYDILTPDAVTASSGDRLKRVISGTSNKTLTLSAWFRPTYQSVVMRTIFPSDSAGFSGLMLTHYKSSTGGFVLDGYNSSNTRIKG